MPTIEYNGKSFSVDRDGFLIPECAFGTDFWNDYGNVWIDYVKGIRGIDQLTDEHQKVMDTLGEYYEINGVVPLVRIWYKVTGFPLSRIYELFPFRNPPEVVCSISGLPKPNFGC